jgi:hypothetical protein
MGSGAESAVTGGSLATGSGAAGSTSWWDAFTAPGGTGQQWMSQMMNQANPSAKLTAGGPGQSKQQGFAPPPGQHQGASGAMRSLATPSFDPKSIGGVATPGGPQYSILGKGQGDSRMAMLRMLLGGRQ